tara:strand:+ start:528 stop:1226 length:699 start_codon:yes stop_codon:yes gene_type:complete
MTEGHTVHGLDEVLTSSDGITLSKIEYENKQTIVWPRQSHSVDITKAEYHPETNSLIKDTSPWLFYTPTPDSEGAYMSITYPILQNGVSANEVAKHFIESADCFDAGLNSDGIFELLLDASVWWRQTEWTSIAAPYYPLWLRLDQEVLEPTALLACTVPKNLSMFWNRFALPLFAGKSVEINKSGDECYFVSVESDLICGDKTLGKDKIIKLSSPTVTVTAQTDTILLKVYR